MSAYSTLNITRSKALEAVLAHVTSGLSDAELGEFMDRLLEPRLYNVRIVADDSENDDAVL